MGRSTVYNRIFNEEDWAKVNPKNKELFDEWKFYLQSVNKSEGSIKQYYNDLRILAIFLMKYCGNKYIVDLNKRDIIKFQGHSLNVWGHSPNRVRRLRSCLSSLCNYVENFLDDMYPEFRNVVNKIEAPVKTPVREKTIFTDEDIQNILDHLENTKQYQKACVFSLVANSGVRLNESLRFKVSYFDKENLHDNAYYKTADKIRLKGRGKQGKLRHKYVLKEGFQKYFDLWIKERERLEVDCEYLFVTRENGEWVQAKESTIQSWKRSINKATDKPFYFHSLRHYLTTKLRRIGVPDNIIKDWFSWESLDLISIYDDNNAEDSFGEFFTSSGIKGQDKKNLSDL